MPPRIADVIFIIFQTGDLIMTSDYQFNYCQLWGMDLLYKTTALPVARQFMSLRQILDVPDLGKSKLATQDINELSLLWIIPWKCTFFLSLKSLTKVLNSSG